MMIEIYEPGDPGEVSIVVTGEGNDSVKAVVTPKLGLQLYKRHEATQGDNKRDMFDFTPTDNPWRIEAEWAPGQWVNYEVTYQDD